MSYELRELKKQLNLRIRERNWGLALELCRELERLEAQLARLDDVQALVDTFDNEMQSQAY